MPPKASKVKSQLSTLRFDDDPPPAKRMRPLTKPFAFNLNPSQNISSPSRDDKGKAKAKQPLPVSTRGDGQLWVDMHEPKTEAELAVHKRKVEDVRRWLMEALDGGPSGVLRKYRRILALTGPAGAGKTATIRVLARELGFDIIEWNNGLDDRFGSADVPGEAHMQKFNMFLKRASAYTCVLQDPTVTTTTFTPSSSSSSGPSLSQKSPAAQHASRRRIILLEDLPNILHGPTQASFHSSLNSLIESTVPVVIIVSDAGLRGEDLEGGSTAWRKKEIIDVRTVLGPLLRSPFVTQISFNAVAPTLLRPALQAVLTSEFRHRPSMSQSKPPLPSKALLDDIIGSSAGDIRSALMTLQFACVAGPRIYQGKNKSTKNSGAMVAVTNREHSLQLFHLMGKVMYNKRKGDPANSSQRARDIERDKNIDKLIKDPPPLPPWLSDHERRGSRVNIDTLYADAPIDSSLFGLYTHQNYPQFCDDIEQCTDVAEWLSWADWDGAELWQHANPHRFHLLALGTLHSLPSPVPRRSQKFFKPEWFDVVKRENDGWAAVEDVRDWTRSLDGPRDTCLQVGWSKTAVATEIGGILKARDAVGHRPLPPSSHRTFSKLVFIQSSQGLDGAPLAEDDTGDVEEMGEDELLAREGGSRAEVSDNGWLESDDIEEF